MKINGLSSTVARTVTALRLLEETASEWQKKLVAGKPGYIPSGKPILEQLENLSHPLILLPKNLIQSSGCCR